MRALPLPSRPAGRRARKGPSAGTYLLFYCGLSLGAGLLVYAVLFLSGPPPAPPPRAAETAVLLARIQLNQSDGKGQCRQVVFDNASGNFEEAGMSRCQHLIPDDLLVDTVQTRANLSSAFIRAFRR
jgi:hypothetical protein